jgi:hypothetical protein
MINDARYQTGGGAGGGGWGWGETSPRHVTQLLGVPRGLWDQLQQDGSRVWSLSPQGVCESCTHAVRVLTDCPTEQACLHNVTSPLSELLICCETREHRDTDVTRPKRDFCKALRTLPNKGVTK